MATSSLCNGGPVAPGLGIEQTLRALEGGSVMVKFFPRRRPERRSFSVKLETRQIIWQRTVGKYAYEGSVDLREVKEVRPGKVSRDFERWPDECKKVEPSLCFVVFYGCEFRLKTLSVAAMTAQECEQWIKGLTYLASDTISSSYPLQVERWLRKEFYNMENNRNMLTLKDLKAFFPRVHYKISNSRLKELYQEVDSKRKGEIGFEAFAAIYHILMQEHQLFEENFETYSKTKSMVTVQEFQKFLIHEQKDLVGNDERMVSKFMREYLQDPIRDAQEPYFTMNEFVDFLFSKQNELWDSRHNHVNQDMTHSLSHYWVASSHNTYLTGDQFQSESAVEAYARCLRMGCRCIELDCWDGPDGMPYIYHGHTLTSKIKFLDVVKIIKEHAFVTSEYPVILSIEDHCTLPQQRNMAQAFLDIFGEMLLTQSVDKDETTLPSPHALRRKILIKHKKLPEGTEERLVLMRNDDSQEGDLSNSVKNGILYMEDPYDKEWKRHFFVLTQNKMFYTEEQRETQLSLDDDEEADHKIEMREGVANDELHFSEEWFHGKLKEGRAKAEELLHEFSYLGDGTFLIRESETFVGDFSLSFWRQGKVNHCRIRSRQERGQTKYFLIDTVAFDSLFSLVSHYRIHPLRSQEFLMILKNPVPQPNKHEGKEWYHAAMGREVAEELLKCVPYDGSFLVRKSETDDKSFAISFRSERKIKHCRIKQEGRLFIIGTAQFESLVDLVNYYEKHPLYRKMKLKYPVNKNVVNRIGVSIETMPLGNMQKGSIDIIGCSVDVLQGGRCESGKDWVFRIISPTQTTLTPIEIAAPTREEMLDWVKKVRETAQEANDLLRQGREIERTLRIAKELSNLIVYCRSVPFCFERLVKEGGPCNFYEMSSFPETKVEKWIGRQFCKIRVYPKGQRIDSSNYDPIRLWNCGCQMVALNYQTPDRTMQLNEGKFRQNGNCGYILRPEFTFRDDYDPYNKNTLGEVESLMLCCRIIGARHLSRPGRGIANPYVEVEIAGADYDSSNKYKTRIKVDNGFNPIWNETFEFDIINPDMALIRFLVLDEDMFGDPGFLGQATFPVRCIRPGYRSVPLTNGYSEYLELSSLLVHLTIRSAKEEDKVGYTSLLLLREQSQDLIQRIEAAEGTANGTNVDVLRAQLCEAEQQLLIKNDERRKRAQSQSAFQNSVAFNTLNSSNN
uniref:1-phosphatidylinositol 4,5-bisphosphate phosphodiesterase gamma n=1 Tax=Strigamia maritima TaxID=126957 RepID=T1IHK2_STRMM